MPLSTPTLISRLRASSRLCIMVLALFVLKIGMVHACASYDLNKELSASAGSTQVDSTDAAVGENLAVDDDSPAPGKHAFGSCPDCNCHHGAAMLPRIADVTLYRTQSTYFSTATYFNQIATRSNFRPPIL